MSSSSSRARWRHLAAVLVLLQEIHHDLLHRAMGWGVRSGGVTRPSTISGREGPPRAHLARRHRGSGRFRAEECRTGPHTVQGSARIGVGSRCPGTWPRGISSRGSRAPRGPSPGPRSRPRRRRSRTGRAWRGGRGGRARRAAPACPRRVLPLGRPRRRRRVLGRGTASRAAPRRGARRRGASAGLESCAPCPPCVTALRRPADRPAAPAILPLRTFLRRTRPITREGEEPRGRARGARGIHNANSSSGSSSVRSSSGRKRRPRRRAAAEEAGAQTCAVALRTSRSREVEEHALRRQPTASRAPGVVAVSRRRAPEKRAFRIGDRAGGWPAKRASAFFSRGR